MTVAAPERVALPQLADAANYQPNSFMYVPRAELEAAGRKTFPSQEDWLKIFYDSIASFQRTAAADENVDNASEKAANFALIYKAMLDDLAATGDQSKINCLELCRLREHALIKAGFEDIYLQIKSQENLSALDLLPSVLAELDAEENQHQRWELIIRGICAANIFDLGAAHTTDLYHNEGVSFHDAREKLLSRPWSIDHMDRLVDRLTSHNYHKALIFVDNSGSDVLLGQLPFARELIRNGTQVIIAANELPSINDITAAELDALLPNIAAVDDVLCKAISSRQLIVVSSGNALSVIDLRDVSTEVVDAAGDADFVVLEGMGRSIETNLHAKLSCDALKIGMVKHPEVAAELDGRMLDCVVKFDEKES